MRDERDLLFNARVERVGAASLFPCAMAMTPCGRIDTVTARQFPPAAAATAQGIVECADLPPCPHRYYSPGYASYGGDIPPRAEGAYFPGDDAGFRCKLTLELCSDHPPDCPEW